MIIKSRNRFWRLNLINCIYQLTSPGKINLKFENINFNNKVIVRPEYMSICHADQRYYRGKRPAKILKKKLPMALIHECSGVVLQDNSNKFLPGTKVVLIPNILAKNHDNNNKNIYENYEKGSKFRSSGVDGFMQEIIAINNNRLVAFDYDSDCESNNHIFAITELMSVAVHAVKRFLKNINNNKNNKIAVFGDGNVGFLVSLVLRKIIPNSEIIVIGRHEEKLANFSFANQVFLDSEIPENLEFNHAFECTGNTGSFFAINNIINHINPQGTVILMGVSEEKILINTRNILEKGLKFIGCSRSGFEDFFDSVKIMQDKKTQKRILNLITFGGNINLISDIHRVFDEVLHVPFKLVFKWNL